MADYKSQGVLSPHLSHTVRSVIWQAFAMAKAVGLTPPRILPFRFIRRERKRRHRRHFLFSFSLTLD
jgi:hypothetical protein